MSDSKEITKVESANPQMDAIENTVAYFACMMRNKLYDNMHKGGWRLAKTDYLVQRFLEESGEMIGKMLGGAELKDWEDEAYDCANFLMMLVDPARKP